MKKLTECKKGDIIAEITSDSQIEYLDIVYAFEDMFYLEDMIDGVRIHYIEMFEDPTLYIEEFTVPYDVFVGNYWEWIEKTEKFW